jgi:hypothetical protein
MVAESGKLSKSGLGIGGNGCFGAAISKPLMAEIGGVETVAWRRAANAYCRDPFEPFVTGSFAQTLTSALGGLGSLRSPTTRGFEAS